MKIILAFLAFALAAGVLAYLRVQDIKEGRNRGLILIGAVALGIVAAFLVIPASFAIAELTGLDITGWILFILYGVGVLSFICISSEAASKHRREVLEEQQRQAELQLAAERRRREQLNTLQHAALDCMGLKSLRNTDADYTLSVNSSQALNSYDEQKFAKQYGTEIIEKTLAEKAQYLTKVKTFLKGNTLEQRQLYDEFAASLRKHAQLIQPDVFLLTVSYTTPKTRERRSRTIRITENQLQTLQQYSVGIDKEKMRQILEEKKREYCEKFNEITAYAADTKEYIIMSNDDKKVDAAVSKLYSDAVKLIERRKSVNDAEWTTIQAAIDYAKNDIQTVRDNNKRFHDYYESEDFANIKTLCSTLMDSQREFNEYIEEKAEAITTLLGTRVERGETQTEDTYQYIRPYKKDVDPFTAQVSAAVFASAENNPLEYVVKCFYPDKTKYPEQLYQLQTLVEELETLREARDIIANYQQQLEQYLSEVPDYIMEFDKDGFYSKLGFANLSEKRLNIEYKFVYTSNGGFAQRSFSVPMTEENIIRLIDMLQSKLTYTAFAKEQRNLMTKALREQIKARDNYTCKYCGNSTSIEPNLLLEVDHIIPVAKGGYTQEENLQTLCWKCNRSKSAKIL